MSLKVAEIKSVSVHPDADALYVLELDDGSEEGRTIVSGIREQYSIEELVGKKIIVVANLKPAKLRGIKSNGMLLAASKKLGDEEKETVDVIFVDSAESGDAIVPQGSIPSDEYSQIKVDAFFSHSIYADGEYKVGVSGEQLQVYGKEIGIRTQKVSDAGVG